LRAEDYIAHAGFDYLGGRDAAQRLLENSKLGSTAIFACSDQQAIGVLRMAVDRGLAVPRDLSVVGFDGIMLAELVAPRLTTVVQPVAQIADAAVAMLLDRKGGLREAESELFACSLAKRESCAPPKDLATKAQ